MAIRIWSIALLLFIAACAVGQSTGIVKNIVVNGNQQVSRDAILAAMRTKVGQPYVQETLNQDKAAIEALGFFESVDPRPRILDDNNWEVVVEVKEFPEVKEIRIVGNRALPTEDLLKEVTFAVGRPFNINEIQPTVNRLQELYTRRGFFARVAEIGPLRDSPNTVNITMVEFVVNQVSVQGNVRTKDSVMRRLIKTKAGEPLNTAKWGRDLQRLSNTQWFETVNSAEEEVDLGRINLIANVKEGRTGIFNIGVQLDPRSSFAGLLKVTDTNFRGTGQSVGINLVQSTAGGGTSIDLDYGNQFIDRHDTSMKVSLYSRVLYRFAGIGFGGGGGGITDDNAYTERRTGGSLSFVRPIGDTIFASVGARFEGVQTNDRNRGGSGFIQQDGEVGSVTLGVTRNRRDVDLDPANGDWFRVEVEPGFARISDVGGATSDRSLIGRHNFVKGTVEYRAYFGAKRREFNKLDEPVRTLALRVRYGHIAGKVPFYEQFFAGGSDTVRGYDEDRFWGRQTLVSNLEYRIPIQKAFNMVLFADYGGAWGGYETIRRFDQSDKLKLNLGYGIGFSFRTPLGPIRLDFGFNNKGGSRTHFLIGTSF